MTDRDELTDKEKQALDAYRRALVDARRRKASGKLCARAELHDGGITATYTQTEYKDKQQ